MLRHAIGARKKEQQDLKKKRDKMMKIKDFTSCIGHGAVSVSESCGRNISRTSVNTSEQNVLNIHVGATKNQSGILNCRIEETNINEPTVNIRSPSYSNLHADCGFPIGIIYIMFSQPFLCTHMTIYLSNLFNPSIQGLRNS